MINLKKILDFNRIKVGIQIGDTSLKIVVLKNRKHSNGLWDIQNTITEELAEGVVSEGKILQPEILGLKIKETLANNHIKVKKVSVFIEELPFFVRKIQLPKVSKKELKDTIFYKSQLEFPVDVNELFIQHSYLGNQIVGGILQEEYIVIAVYRNSIEKAILAINKAGLVIETFGLEPEAIYRGLKNKKLIDHISGSFLLVRKDSKRLMLTIYSNDQLMYSRYTPIFSQSERENAEEITRTIFSWNGKHTNNIIKEVILLGEETDWEQTSEEIQLFMPSLTIDIVTAPFTACLGIALKDLNEENFNINLNKKSRKITTDKFIIEGLIVAIVLVISVFLYFINNEIRLENDIQELTNNINDSEQLLELLNTRKELLSNLRELETMQSKSTQDHIDIAPFIHNIFALQPSSIQISKIVFSQDTIHLQGKGVLQEDVVEFLKKLQHESNFSNIKLIQSSGSSDGSIFNMDIQINSSSLK